MRRGTVRNSHDRDGAAVWLLHIDEANGELLHLGDTRGTANKYDLVDLGLLQAGDLPRLLDQAQCVLKRSLSASPNRARFSVPEKVDAIANALCGVCCCKNLRLANFGNDCTL